MRKKRTQAENVPPPLEQRRVTPVDIQQKEFRLAVRGYNERDVDQFLDEVTEEVARLYADNKRLREEVEFGKTTRLETSGAGEADAVIRQAREEAARILAEATARASTVGAQGVPARAGSGPAAETGSPPSEIMGIFLARERAFLQNMANLIQAHAEGVKHDVRVVREQLPRPAPQAQSQSPAPTPEAQTDIAGTQAESEEPTEQPTQAWQPRSESAGSEGTQSHDVVDLTGDDEEAPASAGEDASGSGEEISQAQAALSPAYGTAHPKQDAGNASRAGRSWPAMSTGPAVEDEDPKEDRSIRELFWGED